MRLQIVIALCLLAGGVWAADESWRLPLAEKEPLLEKNCVEKHNILGLYPSQVDVSLADGSSDPSTRGYANIAHSVCWTANYLAGASYRYAFLKKSGASAEAIEQARLRADELFEAVYRCQLVTGVKGLQSRGYAIGHGESYEEREDVPTADEWHQGAGEYKDLRWRGSPSHHNYSDSTHGLMQYYDLAAEGVQKDRARDAIVNLVDYWVDNNFNIQHLDPEENTPILGWTDGKTLNTRIMMAIAQAKYGHYVSGEERFKAMYDRLLDQFGVRGLESFKTDKDFDDAEHVFSHLENLFRIEKDPELLAAYRKVADGLWANHKDDAQSLFTYIYANIAPDMADRDKALREALYSLQTWPTDMTIQPRMSSLRGDLKPPYPVYAAAWDNEYIWKGNLLNPDGWLSRIVVDVAVSAEDPLVIYAVDSSGEVYQSRDGAATAGQWFPIDAGLCGARPLRLDAGSRIRLLSAVCQDAFYLSTSAGQMWQRLPCPAEGEKPVALLFDAEDVNVVYAVTDKAVYRSEKKRRKPIGAEWEPFKGNIRHPVKVSTFAGEKTQAVADPGDTSVLYKAGDRQGALKSVDGGKTWTASTTGLDIPVVVTVIAPPDTDWIFAGTPAGLYVSKDSGETWESANLVLQFTKNIRRELGGAAFIDAYWRARYRGFIDDATAMAAYTAEK
ncbi:MAG TPA: hypothetical protein PLO37_21265 [Candidatus Hydrogenedentes bacterium]|nr:hypothetical protein [Candidatus Hydrogenedentota bacterium]HPG69383.1 hypothetical protein [Candidatus Hydrogenedentota bacterium]